MAVGLLGGTFDPVHMGHLIVAQEVQFRLKLEAVVFLPARLPWFKEGRAITAREHRLAMLRLAIAGNPAFTISTLELERPGRTYSVESMPALQAQYGELHFIMGADALAELPRWKEPRRFLEYCSIAAVGRPGFEIDLAALEEALPGAAGRITLVEAPLLDISSTDIRARLARGEPVRYLVPEAVERYIRAEGVYGHT